jgi:hypothetical protein
MELEIKTCIYIDIVGLINDYGLTNKSTDKEIKNAISNYTTKLDFCKYYLIGEEEEEKIFKKTIDTIKKI